MYALMCSQIPLVSEFPFTYITRIWALTAMYALMYYQNALYPECFVTHVT